VEMPQMLLKKNYMILNKISGWDTGEIAKGNTADLAVIDYDPATPMNEENFLGHFLFGMTTSNVDATISNGKIIMKNRKMVDIDVAEISLRAREIAQKVWERIR